MLIPPKYFLTPKITQFLQIIEANKAVIAQFSLPKEIEVNLRRQSVLKSSLFSAKIEGNPLTLEDLPQKSSQDQKKREVFNILKGFEYINSRGQARDLSAKTVLELHRRVMEHLIDESSLGEFRHEVSAIFNSAGIAIYLPPPPGQISKLIEKLLLFAKSTKEPFIPIRAALTHYSFEKIHPFLDGNGRVGRLVLNAILIKNGYGMGGLTSIEEFLDLHRSRYYRGLDDSEKDVTDYVEFILEAIAESSTAAKTLVTTKQNASPVDYLLPRRAEILNIIRDHKMVNFDTIKRRFMSINERTLRYDLKKLADAGLVKKLGTTNGVYYEIVL